MNNEKEVLISLRFKNKFFCPLSVKKFEVYGNQFILTEIVNPSHRLIHQFYKNHITLHKSAKYLRTFRMCNTLKLNCRYKKSTITIISSLHCRNKMVSWKLWVHKQHFQPVDRNDYQCPQLASVFQAGSTPFNEKTKSFFLTGNYGIFVFKETQKSIQDNIAIAICSGRYGLGQKFVYVHALKKNGENRYECLH